MGIGVAFLASLAKPAVKALRADPFPQAAETVFIKRVDLVLFQRSLVDTYHCDVIGAVGIGIVTPAG